jgi:Family of unknown function (DUF5994)
MSSVPRNRTSTSKATEAAQSPRLTIKPAALTRRDAGHVDGAWWPRSRDLSAELPALFEALAARLGIVDRMAYNLTEWDVMDRRIDADGHRVRLGGFRYQGANTVGVTGVEGERLTLLVIPPETPASDARRVSFAAASQHNIDSVDNLLDRRGTRLRRRIPAPRVSIDDRRDGVGTA